MLFDMFTQLQVSGNLYVYGTQQQRVVFTSRRDSTYNPHPNSTAAHGDWSQIFIDSKAKAVFKYTDIKYSSLGIVSESQNIMCEQMVFCNTTTESFFMLEGKIPGGVVPTQNQPFNHNLQQGTITITTNPPRAVVFIDGIKKDSLSPLTNHRLTIGRYTIKALKNNRAAEQNIKIIAGMHHSIALAYNGTVDD